VISRSSPALAFRGGRGGAHGGSGGRPSSHPGAKGRPRAHARGEIAPAPAQVIGEALAGLGRSEPPRLCRPGHWAPMSSR
jgi:hypothetical protein